MFHRQTIFAGGGPEPADCLRAAVASLTGIHPSRVPHFARYGHWWWDLLRAWARTRGADFGCLPAAGDVRRQLPATVAPGTLLLAAGPSPRRADYRHAVLVDLDLHLVHDPHPSDAGLPTIDEVYAWCAPYPPAPAVAGLAAAVVLA